MLIDNQLPQLGKTYSNGTHTVKVVKLEAIAYRTRHNEEVIRIMISEDSFNYHHFNTSKWELV